MKAKELISKLDEINTLALEMKGRHAANVIAVKTQDLIQETHASSQVNRCRCGVELLTVSSGETHGTAADVLLLAMNPHETPPKFCSEKCKEKELILSIADLLADLPDPLLAVMERAFSVYASYSARVGLLPVPGVVAEVQQLQEATQIARCL